MRQRGLVDRRQLLKRLEKAWLAFNESYAGLSDVQLMEPGATGAWSVRDILAHVTTWEEEALKHLPLILKGATPKRYSVRYGDRGLQRPHGGTQTEPVAGRGARAIGGNAQPARRLHSERSRTSTH